VCRFLLVSLKMDAILGEVTIRQRRKKLEVMRGNGLGDAYTATLTRLKAQKGYRLVLGLKVLMWVLHSERPLRAQELCHALGVEIGSADLDLDNVPALLTLVAPVWALSRLRHLHPQSGWCTLLFRSISLAILPYSIILTQQLPKFA